MKIKKLDDKPMSFTPRRKPRFMPMNQREPRLKAATSIQ